MLNPYKVNALKQIKAIVRRFFFIHIISFESIQPIDSKLI